MFKRIVITGFFTCLIMGAINGAIAMEPNKRDVVPIETTAKEVPVDGVKIDQAMVVEVNSEGNRVLVQPSVHNHHELIALNITKETKITSNGTAINLTELQEEQMITILHSKAMTRSLPPQTAAYEVEVIE